MTAVESVLEAVGGFTFGQAQTFRNLTIDSARSRMARREADYATLDEALALGTVAIEETSDAGQVPELKGAAISGDRAVLLLDGEELIGAKQNRVLNLSILVPPQSSRTIPVSCVESRALVAQVGALRVGAARPECRRAATRGCSRSRSRCAPPAHARPIRAPCGTGIEKKMSRLGARSETAAMSAMYEDLQTAARGFRVGLSRDRRPGRCGVPRERRGRAGLELFDTPAAWNKLSSKLVRSYAIDAIDCSRKAAEPATPAKARAVIDAITSSQASVFDAVGEGSDVRPTGPEVGGAALVARGRTIM